MVIRSITVLVLVGSFFTFLPALTIAQPDTSPSCEFRNNNTIEKLLECVTVEGVREHQAAFQAIADANGGTRASGTPGYVASVDYVASQLQAAGYDVTIQEFMFEFFEVLTPSVLEQISPTPTSYVDGEDFAIMGFSGSGDVTATVQAVDLTLPPGPAADTSTSGCEASDFAGFTPGNIALIQRGSCSFAQKAQNAEAAGAVGVIIFNEGQEGRTDVIFGTLGSSGISIPVVGASFALGIELAQASGPVVRLFTDTRTTLMESANVFAETRSGDDSNVIMVGAHLDSVPEGPGINDNGSGSAAILEVALQMQKVKPRNTVRFAWWGAEEFGLFGSDNYVFGLSEDELDDIALYLNFDMIGSPNYVRFIYDGDGSAFGLAGPPGSDEIETLFQDFYGERELAFEPTEIDFRSDYAAFFDVGIPFGGLFTGAEGIKTPAQAATYGGTAGIQYDPCYHQACDTFDNVSLEVLDLNADAVAFATLHYAMEKGSLP